MQTLPKASELSQQRVLLVEDSEAQRWILQKTFAPVFASVSAAASVAEALSVTLNNPTFDWLFSDLHLDAQSCQDLFAQIPAAKLPPRIVVMSISADAATLQAVAHPQLLGCLAKEDLIAGNINFTDWMQTLLAKSESVATAVLPAATVIPALANEFDRQIFIKECRGYLQTLATHLGPPFMDATASQWHNVFIAAHNLQGLLNAVGLAEQAAVAKHLSQWAQKPNAADYSVMIDLAQTLVDRLDLCRQN